MAALVYFDDGHKSLKPVVRLEEPIVSEGESGPLNQKIENLIRRGEGDQAEITAIAISLMNTEQLVSLATQLARIQITNREIDLDINTDKIQEGILVYTVLGDSGYLTIVANQLVAFGKQSESPYESSLEFHLAAAFITAAQAIASDLDAESFQELISAAQEDMQKRTPGSEAYASATLDFYTDLLSSIESARTRSGKSLSIEDVVKTALETLTEEQVSQIENKLFSEYESLRLSAERLTVSEIQSTQDKVARYLGVLVNDEAGIFDGSLLDNLDWLAKSKKVRSISTAEESLRTISRVYQGSKNALEFLKDFAWSNSNNPFLRAVAIQGISKFWKGGNDTLRWLKEIAESSIIRDIQAIAIQEVVRGNDEKSDTLTWIINLIEKSENPKVIAMILEILARYYPDSIESISYMRKFSDEGEDLEIREAAIRGFINCGKNFVDKQKYEQAISIYGEARQILKESDEKYRKGLARAFRVCASKLSPVPRISDSKKIRLMTVSALDQSAELVPLTSTMPLMEVMQYIWAYQRVDRNEDAIALAERLDKSNTIVAQSLAYSYLRSGRYNEALEVCQDAIDLDPKDSDNLYIYSLLKDIHQAVGNYDEAIASLQHILEYDSATDFQKHIAYRDLCWLYVDLGRYEDSIAAGEQAVELFPKLPSLISKKRIDYNNLAATYVEIGDYDSAIHYINLALESDPEYFSVKSWRCHIDVRLGNLARAEKDLRYLIEEEWKPSGRYFLLGVVYALQERAEESQASFQKALENRTKFSLTQRIRYAFNSVVLGDMDGIGQMQEILLSYQPPAALLRHEILPYTEILSRCSPQHQGLDLLVQLTENYMVS